MITSYLCQSEVDSVSERGNDQTSIETHVLVTISKLSGALSDHQLISLFLPVESELRLPAELTRIHDTVPDESVNDVTSVDLNDKHCVELCSVVFGEG